MKNFFNDYWEMSKASFDFVKRHPVGIGISMLIGVGINIAAVCIPNIIEKKRIEKELRNRVMEYMVLTEEEES